MKGHDVTCYAPKGALDLPCESDTSDALGCCDKCQFNLCTCEKCEANR